MIECMSCQYHITKNQYKNKIKAQQKRRVTDNDPFKGFTKCQSPPPPPHTHTLNRRKTYNLEKLQNFKKQTIRESKKDIYNNTEEKYQP